MILRSLKFFLISIIILLSCGYSWSEEPATNLNKLAITIREMDEISRQINFEFNEKVIPDNDEIKEILKKRAGESEGKTSPLTDEAISDKEIQDAIENIK